MSVLNRCIETIISDKAIKWYKFNKKTILITGASGLYGKITALSLLHNNKINVRLILQTRHKEVLIPLLPSNSERITFVESIDAINNLPIDYIFHYAAPTRSSDFSEKPVETIKNMIDSTIKILDLAKEKKATILYASSMEVYGQINKLQIKEEEIGLLDLYNVRSSYPESKRVSELLCYCAHKENNLKVFIVRPTLTFGPGISASDNRVFAQFAKSVISGIPIVLHTEGATCRDYIHIADAIRGLFYIILSDNKEILYNLSSPNTYTSIRGLAEIFGEIGKVPVVINSTLNNKQYAPEIHISLNVEKLLRLGWRPIFGLKETVKDLCDYLNETL